MFEWLRLLLPVLGNGAIGVITFYGDDTGIHDKSPVVGFGGLFGDGEQWTEFEASWKSRLLVPLSGKPP
jgi:hypothetical protein